MTLNILLTTLLMAGSIQFSGKNENGLNTAPSGNNVLFHFVLASGDIIEHNHTSNSVALKLKASDLKNNGVQDLRLTTVVDGFPCVLNLTEIMYTYQPAGGDATFATVKKFSDVAAIINKAKSGDRLILSEISARCKNVPVIVNPLIIDFVN